MDDIKILFCLAYLVIALIYIKVFYQIISSKTIIMFLNRYNINVNESNKTYLVFATVFNIVLLTGAAYLLFINKFLVSAICSLIFIVNISAVRKKFGINT